MCSVRFWFTKFFPLSFEVIFGWFIYLADLHNLVRHCLDVFLIFSPHTFLISFRQRSWFPYSVHVMFFCNILYFVFFLKSRFFKIWSSWFFKNICRLVPLNDHWSYLKLFHVNHYNCGNSFFTLEWLKFDYKIVSLWVLTIWHINT